MKVSILRLTGKSFQGLGHVQFPLMLTLTWVIDILFEKLTLVKGGWIWKTPFTLCLWGWGFHTKPVFFLNIFSGGLHFDALILEVGYSCIIISLTLGGGKI